MTNQKQPNIPSFNSSKFGLLSPNGSNPNGDGSNVDQFVAYTANGIALMNKCEFNLTSIKTITSAQLLSLNTTPIEVIPNPGTGFGIVVKDFIISHGAGTAYAGIAGGEDLVLKYTNGGGAEVSQIIEATGFLDQATAQIRMAGSITSSLTPSENGSIVLQLTSGNITTGTFDLQLLVRYDIIPTDFIGN